MIKMLDFFVNRYYFKTLNKKGLINDTEHSNYSINEIKIFQSDKIICLSDNNQIIIFNIIGNNLLCKYNMENNLDNNNSKIEIFNKDLVLFLIILDI